MQGFINISKSCQWQRERETKCRYQNETILGIRFERWGVVGNVGKGEGSGRERGEKRGGEVRGGE